MVATSIFSTGNDHSHVQLIVHMDRPFDMLEFIQGQKRAGRDGEHAECYMLIPKHASQPSSKETGCIIKDDRMAMYDHLYTYGLKHCLWYGIILYCHDLDDNQLCCVCNCNSHHAPRTIHIANLPKAKIL